MTEHGRTMTSCSGRAGESAFGVPMPPEMGTGPQPGASPPSIRVPASLALLALHQSGHHIKPSTLRMWVRRGHITRGPGGYDLGELLTYLDTRYPPTQPLPTQSDNDQRVSA